MRCLLSGLAVVAGAFLGGCVGVWLALPALNRELAAARSAPGAVFPFFLFLPLRLPVDFLEGALIGGLASAVIALAMARRR